MDSGAPLLPPLVRYGYLTPREYEAVVEYSRKDSTGKLRDQTGYIDCITALGRDNLPFFCTSFLGYQIVPHAPNIWQEVKDHTRNGIKIPRSHAKSQFFVLGRSIQRICYAAIKEAPEPRLLLMQETGTQAEKAVLAIRERLLKGYDANGPRDELGLAFGSFKERIVKMMPNLLWLDLDGEVKKDPTLEGVGIEGAITGGHPTDLLGDDMCSYENSRTPQARLKHWEWWIRTPQGMIDPGTWVGLLHTPKFDDDLHARIEKTKRYKFVANPALNRWPTEKDYELVHNADGEIVWVRLTDRGFFGDPDNGIEPLRALWPCPHGRCIDHTCADGGVTIPEAHRTPQVRGTPLHRSVEYMIFDKYLDDRVGFGSEFMLEHIASDAQPIKKEFIRCYSFFSDDWGKPDPYSGKPIVRFPTLDPAKVHGDIYASSHGWDHAMGKGKTENDETAHARLYRTTKNDVFVIARSGDWKPDHVIEMMQTQFETDPYKKPFKIVSEAINFQATFGMRVLEEGKVILPIDMVTHAPDKFTAMVENGYYNHLTVGKVFFDVRDQETITQHIKFQAKKGGYRKDRVDACRLAFGPLGGRVKKVARTRATGNKFNRFGTLQG